MLSPSAAVAPLRPVLGVWVSLDWDPDRGTFNKDDFCFELPSPAVPLSVFCCPTGDGACDDDVGVMTVS
jgi:hypothetical protein